MKDLLKNAKDSFIPLVTKSVDNAADKIRETANNLTEPGNSGLITKGGGVSQNVNSKGFAFEHTQEAAFNAKAQFLGKPYEAVRVPPGGIDKLNQERGLNLPTERLGEPDIIIFNTETGEAVKTYQAKMGTEEYISSAVRDDKYENTDAFVVNSENSELAEKFDNVSTVLSHDGVESIPISEDTSLFIAENPDLSDTLAEASADGAEVAGGAAMGGGIAAALVGIQSSIKILAKFYKGEDVNKDVLLNALKEVCESAKSGAARGVIVKILQIIIDSDSGALPVVIVSVGMEVFPKILQYMNDEITFDQLIKECGLIATSKSIIVILCMTYPPIGLSIMGYAILSTVWTEFELGVILNKYIPANEYLTKINDGAIKAKLASQAAASVVADKALEASVSIKSNTGKAGEATINAANAVADKALDASVSIKDNAGKAGEVASSFINKSIESMSKLKSGETS